MKEKIKDFGIIILVLAILILSAVLFGDSEEASIFFIMLVVVSFLLYSTYKESVRREEKIRELEEEIRRLKNK